MKNMGNFYYHGSRKENGVTLTFDDGPSQETEKVLDILKKYKAKATFFIWGQRIKGRERIIKKILKEGHEIGNHTFSHKSLWFKSKRFIKEDIEKCDKELRNIRVKTDLFRFPSFRFGINAIVVCKGLKKKVIFCDVISNDWLDPYLRKKYDKKGSIKIDKVVRKVLDRTKSGSIISFHDYLEGIGPNREIVPILEKNMIRKGRLK